MSGQYTCASNLANRGIIPRTQSRLTLVQSLVALLLNHPADGLSHALALAVAGNVHLRLDRDVRVGDARGEELAEGAEDKGDAGRDAALLLDHVLHLLEQGVLQDGVDDEDEGGDDAAEQGLGPLLLEQGQQGADGGRAALALGAGLAGALLLLDVALARRHARVDDPDGVGQDDGGGAGEGAGHHGLERRQLGSRAAGLLRRLLEEGPRPLVPVVVDKVGHADAEHGRVQAGVQARHALARDDAPHRRQEGRLAPGRLDLRARRQGDQGVSAEREKSS